MTSGESAAAYLQRAERSAPQVAGLTAAPMPVRAAGVVGGGTMGVGIAAALSAAGLAVRLIELDEAAAARARERLAEIHDRLVARGRLTAEAARARTAAIEIGSELASLAHADLVIEAVPEDLALKQAVFRDLDAVTGPDTVLATNTSYLDIDAIASVTARPEAVLGLHFFSPANLMRLVEVVRARRTSEVALATALDLAARLGKIAIVARVAEGFIGNRIFAAYRRQCEYLVLDGALPQDVDAAMEAYGLAMGPFQVFDLAGLDIAWKMRQRLAATRRAGERYVALPDRLCELGRFGRKTGAGWYRHDAGARRGAPDPQVAQLIAAERAAAGIVPRHFTDEAIQRALIATMVNEATKLLAEGVAQRASDIDVAMVHGYGFPAARGGPLYAAEQAPLAAILAEMEALERRNGSVSAPAPLLHQLVATGTGLTGWSAS